MDKYLILELAKLLFWIILTFTAIIVFRKEIRTLISSIGSMKIAGNNFEFKNKKEEFQAYANLSDILIDTLSERDAASKFRAVLSLNSVQKLKMFCEKYIREIDKGDWNYELLKNCAVILSLRKYPNDAIFIANKLLEELPEDIDCLNVLAISYSNRKAKGDAEKADEILTAAIQKEPYSTQYYLNRAILYSEMGKIDESFKDLESCRKTGFKEIFTDRGFYNLQVANPEKWAKINNLN